MMTNVRPMEASSAGWTQTTDGSIAARNLDAQIEGLQADAMSGYFTAETQLCLIDLLVLRGRTLGRITDYRRAEQVANQFVRETGRAESLLGRARIHALFHRFPAALDDLDIAQDASIDEHTVEEERAAIFQGLGRYDEALALRQQAVARCASFENLAGLAGLYAERGEIETAQQLHVESKWRYRGVSPFPLALLDFQIGQMWVYLGEWKEARNLFQEAVQRLPAYAPAQGHLAEVEAEIGDRENAVARLYPLAMSSDDPDYASQLARILQDLGRIEESQHWCRLAAAMYSSLVFEYPEAFADHAAEFWLGPGANPHKAVELAQINFAIRKTPRSCALLSRAFGANESVSGSKVKNPKQSFIHEREQNHMATQIVENERTARGQKMTRQPDGPGKRIGKKGEISGIGKVAPGGAKLFRERLPQIQAEAGYWEGRVGTVHDFRVTLIDNDTRILFTIVYDGDFKPYIEDILREAGPWLDQIFLGVWDGFRGSKDRKSVEELLGFAFECDIFYVANPDATARDVTKMQRLSKAVGEMLDAAS